MGLNYSKRELYIPYEDWSKVSKAEFRPLQLQFMANRFPKNIKLTLKLDGAGSRQLAKVLSLFFFFDDYGRLIWDRVLQTMQVLELADARLHFPETEKWQKEQHDRFFEYVESLMEYEGELDEQYARLRAR